MRCSRSASLSSSSAAMSGSVAAAERVSSRSALAAAYGITPTSLIDFLHDFMATSRQRVG